MKQYDYIIAGAGCAGLSLATRMVTSEAFKNKRILLIDKAEKVFNDRTWCFWEINNGFFEPVVYKRWQRLNFYSHRDQKTLDITPYSYKMIRGIDFYEYCFKILKKENVDVVYDNVLSLSIEDDKAFLTVENETYSAEYIFSSILPEIKKQTGKQYIWQHFIGWIIETERNFFDPQEATLMDFRVPQIDAANFVYVLPLAENRAMVEYTTFTEGSLDEEQYDRILNDYVSNHLKDNPYIIKNKEKGSIPMTNHKFKKRDKRIIYIGTAGGNTKPSSGYTFQFIQQNTKFIVDQLIKNKTPLLESNFDRFMWYDSILLRVLLGDNAQAEDIFEKLFFKNPPHQVLKFLDNATNIGEELKIIASLPKIPFIKAAIKETISSN